MKRFNQNKILFIAVASNVILFSCSKSSSTSGPKSSNTVSTYSGAVTAGSSNGTRSSAKFTYPSSLVSGVINGIPIMYVGDFGNNLVRAVNLSSAAVTTLGVPVPQDW